MIVFKEPTDFLVFSFKDNMVRTGHTGYFLPKVEIKYYNVMIDGSNFFYQTIKNDIRTYKNVQKIATGQGND